MIEKEILKQAKLFSELQSQELEEILKITKEIVYKKGDIIFLQGDRSTELYLLTKGEIEIQIRIAPQIADSTVYIVKPYDILGEFAFVDPKPRAATARCNSNCILAMIKREDFEELVKKYPIIGLQCYKSLAQLLSERLRRMDDYLKDIFVRSLGLEVLT